MFFFIRSAVKYQVTFCCYKKLRTSFTANYKYNQNFVSTITISDKNQTQQFLVTAVGGCHNFLHSNFHVSFCFLFFVKCLFYWCGCLIYFGSSLFYFGGCQFYFGSCLIYFGIRLIQFGSCLFQFGGCLFQFGGCFVYFGIRLMLFDTSLIYFGSCLYFFKFNFCDCFVLN